MVERGTISLQEAAIRLGIGKSHAYALASSGKFPCRVLRIGRIYRVPKIAIEQLLGEREPIAEPAGEPVAAQ